MAVRKVPCRGDRMPAEILAVEGTTIGIEVVYVFLPIQSLALSWGNTQCGELILWNRDRPHGIFVCVILSGIGSFPNDSKAAFKMHRIREKEVFKPAFRIRDTYAI